MAAQQCQVLPLQQICWSLSSVFCRRLLPLQEFVLLGELAPGSTASLREAINLAVCFTLILSFVSALLPQRVPAHTQCSGKECHTDTEKTRGTLVLLGSLPPMNCHYIIFLIQPYFCTAVQLHQTQA